MDPTMAALALTQIVSQQSKDSRDRKLASETQRYSPWTHLAAQAPASTSIADPVMQAYAASQANEQAGKNQESGRALQDAQMKYYQSMAQSAQNGGMGSTNYTQQSPWAAMLNKGSN